LIRRQDPATTLLCDLLCMDTNLTECISFDGGGTLQSGTSGSKILEFHGHSEAAGLLLERGLDGKIDPLQSLAVQYREASLKPILVNSLMPVSTGEGALATGEKCGFVLYGFGDSCRGGGTIQGSGVFVWPPESVVQDSAGKCTLTFVG
jgi:hypothetical protein